MATVLELPQNVTKVLNDLVEAARSSFASDLVSVVLYGSAAEGKLRATSDVNLILVLQRFESRAAESFREPLRFAEAAVRVQAMFILESEIPAAAEAFAPKFSDIQRRRRVLFGADPFESLKISRAAEIAELRQQLLNLLLRLRNAYVARGMREEQLARVLADATGPLRAAAASLLQLQGRSVSSPKQALTALVGDDAEMQTALALLSEFRDGRQPDDGQAGAALLQVIRMIEILRRHAESLP